MKWTIYRADGKESLVTSDCPGHQVVHQITKVVTPRCFAKTSKLAFLSLLGVTFDSGRQRVLACTIYRIIILGDTLAAIMTEDTPRWSKLL